MLTGYGGCGEPERICSLDSRFSTSECALTSRRRKGSVYATGLCRFIEPDELWCGAKFLEEGSSKGPAILELYW